MSNKETLQPSREEGLKTIPIFGLIISCIYFLSPVDLIPDGVPGSSIDDLIVLFITGGVLMSRIGVVRKRIVSEIDGGEECIIKAADCLEATNRRLSRLLLWVRAIFIMLVLSTVTVGILALVYRDEVVRTLANMLEGVLNFFFG